MHHPARITGGPRSLRLPGAAAHAGAAILLVMPLIAVGCSRKPLPPTVGAPEDIMKNSEGKVGPMPGTPGYKPPKPTK
jgi:hypothetical protein